MTRSPAYADDHEYAPEQKPLEAVDADVHILHAITHVVACPSIADMQQAEHFKVLLDERHAQIVREIRYKASALAQCQDGDDTGAVRHLRQRLADTYREQHEVDRLRNSLHVRLTTDVPEMARVIRYFDVVVTRRRACWQMEIPELNVVLTNIDRRTDAEVVSRTIVAAITGLPMAGIGVRTRLARPSCRRSQQ
jgi:hypothetical protein